MNDRVEEIFKQMFAPKAIPFSVRNLFEQANFLGSRIDATAMRPIDLAIIGAIGTATTQMATGLERVAIGALVDAGMPITAPDVSEEPQTPSEGDNDTSLTEATITGPTGPMDVPSKPDKKRRGLGVIKLQKMTVKELRVHALEFYGYKVPLQHRKPEIIAILGSKEPIK